jgi:hypothetical protein
LPPILCPLPPAAARALFTPVVSISSISSSGFHIIRAIRQINAEWYALSIKFTQEEKNSSRKGKLALLLHIKGYPTPRMEFPATSGIGHICQLAAIVIPQRRALHPTRSMINLQ